MSRADSKTQLQTLLANAQKEIDWESNVNGDYNMCNTTNPYSTRVDYTGIDGYKGWLIQWQSDNSGVSYDSQIIVLLIHVGEISQMKRKTSGLHMLIKNV